MPIRLLPLADRSAQNRNTLGLDTDTALTSVHRPLLMLSPSSACDEPCAILFHNFYTSFVTGPTLPHGSLLVSLVFGSCFLSWFFTLLLHSLPLPPAGCHPRFF